MAWTSTVVLSTFCGCAVEAILRGVTTCCCRGRSKLQRITDSEIPSTFCLCTIVCYVWGHYQTPDFLCFIHLFFPKQAFTLPSSYVWKIVNMKVIFSRGKTRDCSFNCPSTRIGGVSLQQCIMAEATESSTAKGTFKQINVKFNSL